MRRTTAALVALALANWACGSGSGAKDPGGADPGGVDTASQQVEVADEVPGEVEAPDAGLPEDPGAAVEDAPAEVPPADVPPVVSAECAALQAGKNTLTVDGLARTFWLDLPAATASGRGAFAVVFQWHGVGDTMGNFRAYTRLFSRVDDAAMPFLLVTPETNGDVMQGTAPLLGWDMLEVYSDPPNIEARLFDEVLACLDARWGVDWNHVHSFGFSAGAVMTDLLATLRGDVLASTFTFSGGYLCNPANDTGLNIVWPDFVTQNQFVQVIGYGGVKDTWNFIHFDQFSLADQAFLNGLGHDVILCNHDLGHDIPLAFTAGKDANQIPAYFRDHPKGTVESPYASKLPDGWPAYCEFHAGTK